MFRIIIFFFKMSMALSGSISLWVSSVSMFPRVKYLVKSATILMEFRELRTKFESEEMSIVES
jgi:hypothetical protein